MHGRGVQPAVSLKSRARAWRGRAAVAFSVKANKEVHGRGRAQPGFFLKSKKKEPARGRGRAVGLLSEIQKEVRAWAWPVAARLLSETEKRRARAWARPYAAGLLSKIQNEEPMHGVAVCRWLSL